jgi:hypothetical protein
VEMQRTEKIKGGFYMYYIYTENRFNQVLIFNTYEEAFNWCKSATRWTDDEIKANIKKPRPVYNGATFFSISQI